MTKAFEILVRETQTKLHQLFLKKADKNPNSSAMMQSTKIPWSWVATNVARILIEYPTGLTHVILYSILELQVKKKRTTITLLKHVFFFKKKVGKELFKEIQRI